MTDKINTENIAYEDPFLKFSPLIEARIDEFYGNTESEEAPIQVLQTILTAMANEAHVLIPVEVPEGALEIFDPEKIREGDTIKPDVDLHWKLIHLTDPKGEVSMPVFTSRDKMEEAGAGGCSVISFFMDEYMKQILDMQDVKGMLINPGERSFFLGRELLESILEEHRRQKTKPHAVGPNAMFTEPKDVPEGFEEIMREFIANNLDEVEKVWFTGLADGKDESWLIAVKTDAEEPGKIFDRINTMMYLMGTPWPMDYMVSDQSPWEGAKVIYEKKDTKLS